VFYYSFRSQDNFESKDPPRCRRTWYKQNPYTAHMQKSIPGCSQPRSQALSFTFLAGEDTLAEAGHVYPKFWVAKSIIAAGGVVVESVCLVWKIANLCFIVSGDKHALYNKKS
jgi:hypothetical protein